jgi:hypothetical protein
MPMQGRMIMEGYELDLSEGLSNQITYAVDDIVNLDSKSTAFSKTIIIPGTTNNNNIFGNIFEINNSNFTVDGQPNVLYNFNAALSANCIYEVNGLQVIKGVVRLLEIIIDGKFIEYEVSIIGELGGFINKLGNKRLQDIDFSNYNHVYSVSNIADSWLGNFQYIPKETLFIASGGFNYIIFFGVNFRQLKAGQTFTVSSTASNNGAFTILSVEFLTTGATRFKVVEAVTLEQTIAIINYSVNQGEGYFYPLVDYGNVSEDKINFQYSAFRPALYLRDYVNRIITEAGYTWQSSFFDTAFFKRLVIGNNQKGLFKNNVTDYVNGASTTQQNISTLGPVNVLFGSTTLNQFTYLSGVFTYTGTPTITTKTKVNLRGTVTSTTPGAVTVYIDDVSRTLVTGTFDIELEITKTLNTGDTIAVKFASFVFAALCIVSVDSAEIVTQKDPPGFVDLPLSETVEINPSLPQGIFQKDLFTSVLKMFNLIVSEDKFIEKHLMIEPYPDFYQTSNFLDWSDKLNRGEPYRIKPMSELNARFYNLKFKQDSDFYNENYRKKFNEGYGDRIYDTAYEFAKETETVEVIFSSSVLFGADGTDKVYPAVYKKSGNDSFEEAMDHNIRLLQVKRITDVTSYNILDGTTPIANYDYYGYGGHLDDPDAPASDINFGAPKQLYFTLLSGNLTNNLFNTYYSPYLAEITDKDSKLLTGSFKLTVQDIYDLDFKRLIYIDGALFRLMKVIDFNTNGDELTKCELLKVINLDY